MNYCKAFRGVSICSQNVNSLNYSLGKHNLTFEKKVLSLLKDRPDFCFMQDIRLNGNSTHFENFIRSTKFGNYIGVMASKNSQRGVAIIYKQTLDFSIIETICDINDNYIFIHAKFNKENVLLGSIYSPTYEKDPNFLQKIKRIISSFQNTPTIICGDFNAVTSSVPPKMTDSPNLDLLNTNYIPNLRNTKVLENWIEEQFLFDAFRILYPDKREYSYIPFRNSKQRSRIDLAFVSEQILPNLQSMNYKMPEASVFDHKCITLKLNVTYTKPITINCNDLDQILLKETVLLQAYNTIEDYIELDKFTIEQFQKMRILYENAFKLLLLFLKNNDALMKQFCLNLIDQFYEVSAEIDNFDMLLKAKKNISNSLLLKMLTNNILNNVNSLQKASSRASNLRINSLKQKLEEYTVNDCNSPFLSIIEKEIISHNEKHIENICKNNRKWSVLNNEKPSKVFCAISSKRKSTDNISSISPPPDIDLPTHITSFFQNLYKSKPSKIEISDFLSDDALADLKSRILTSNEQTILDNFITIEELDTVIKNSNLTSAPGHDSFSFKFIHKFWPVFRHFLYNAICEWIENEEILDDFNLAKVKLIPKKDDLTSLSNWRPISLLSCFYKIFSGAIANRFKSVIDKLTSVSQKAYSSQKNIGEILISLNNVISLAKNTNSDLACIAIDFKKAFDLISHEYLLKVLSFYNFGPYFQKLCKTTFKKYAFVDGIGKSSTFQIMSGVAQGDSISGFLFLLSIDILLNQIIFDKKIPYPVFNHQNSPKNIISPKVLAYADDLTVLTVPNNNVVQRLVEILSKFKELSSLECNLMKTSITPIYSSNPTLLSDNLPISVKSSFTTLGMYFSTNTADSYLQNVSKIIQKMSDTVSFWSRMNLSLIGRLTIAKTYLVSYLSYLGPHICFRNEDMETMTNLIADFVKGKLRISQKKVFYPVEWGGLGLPSLEIFIKSLRLNFYKRSLKSNDHWALLIKSTKFHGIEYLHDKSKLEYSPEGSTCILESFLEFSQFFFNHPHRMLDSYIFFNPLITKNGIMYNPLDSHERFKSYSDIQRVSNLRVKHFLKCESDELYTPESFNRAFCFNFKLDELTEIYNLCKPIFKQFRYSQTTVSFNYLFRLKKTRSKHFRFFFSNLNFKNYRTINPPARTRTLKYSYDLHEKNEFQLNKCWMVNFMPNYIREFCYKMLNFNLPMNANLTHFVEDTDASCQNCLRFLLLPPPKESYQHFFMHCPFKILLFSELFVFNDYEQLDGQPFFCEPINKLSFFSRITIFYAFYSLFSQRKVSSINKLFQAKQHFWNNINNATYLSHRYKTFISLHTDYNNKINLTLPNLEG